MLGNVEYSSRTVNIKVTTRLTLKFRRSQVFIKLLFEYRE